MINGDPEGEAVRVESTAVDEREVARKIALILQRNDSANRKM